MSAEVLRRAAALMRERAEAARNVTGAPDWWPDFMPSGTWGVWSSGGPICDESAEEEVRHIASWNPFVALAVAKAMDDVAQAWEITDDGWTRDLDDDPIRFEDTVDGGWLAVARAYLGEQP